MPHVLMVGCGDVATRSALQLIEAGWHVTGLRRHTENLPRPIQPLAADLQQANLPNGWPAHIDYLVYAAAATQHDEAGYRAAYINGLHNTLNWLAEQGQQPKRIVFLSSTGVYGQDQHEWVDEDSPTEPNGFTGQVLLEAEQLLAASGHPFTCLRFAGLYHPDRTWMQDQVRAGWLPDAQPVMYSNRLHRDDAAALLTRVLMAAEAGQPVATCYIGVDDEPAPLHDVVQWLRQQLGVTHTTDNSTRRRAGSKRCSNARAKTLGWQPQYPSYREGYLTR